MPLLASFWFSALVTFSTRSAALVSAAAIAVCAVLLRSKSLDALPRLGEFVCHDNRQHNDQSGISNLAAFAAQTLSGYRSRGRGVPSGRRGRETLRYCFRKIQ